MRAQFDADLVALLSEANLEMGRLDATVAKQVGGKAFVVLSLRAEALAGGSPGSEALPLTEFLRLEGTPDLVAAVPGALEASRWLSALEHGARRLSTRPASLRLVRELEGFLGLPHDERGSERLEKVLSEESGPALLQAGYASAIPREEAAGRLLVPLLLQRRGALRSPVLRWSRFAAANGREHAARREAVRGASLGAGAWDRWLAFFFRGVAAEARAALELSERSASLRASHLARLDGIPRASTLRKTLEVLAAEPVVTATSLGRTLGVTFVTAERTIGRLVDVGLLEEVTGRRRGRRFLYAPLVRLFETAEGGSRTS